jgi:hypothetical protein
VAYINLETTHELQRQTKINQRRTTDFCQKVNSKTWCHYTDYDAFGQYMKFETTLTV